MSIDLAADLPCEKSVGAPGNEIEITPKMIEAGACYLYERLVEHPGFSSYDIEAMAEGVISAAMPALYCEMFEFVPEFSKRLRSGPSG